MLIKILIFYDTIFLSSAYSFACLFVTRHKNPITTHSLVRFSICDMLLNTAAIRGMPVVVDAV